MKEQETIRKYFKPIQPSVKLGENAVTYEEIKPNAQLKELIHCYWQLQTNQVLETPYNYRVVSDGCIDIFFNLNEVSESFVMGFCKKYTEFPIGTVFNYAGIRFYPSVFPQLFKVSAKILKDKAQPLNFILPELATYLSKEADKDFATLLQQLDTFFLLHLQKNTLPIDERFQNALLHICKCKGYLETESELKVGLSPRQLRRLFNYYVGTTPKSFSQVVRFQYILNAMRSTRSLRDNKLYFDVGFVDQAHFIKNFTRFYGVTPAKAFR